MFNTCVTRSYLLYLVISLFLKSLSYAALMAKDDTKEQSDTIVWKQRNQSVLESKN